MLGQVQLANYMLIFEVHTFMPQNSTDLWYDLYFTHYIVSILTSTFGAVSLTALIEDGTENPSSPFSLDAVVEGISPAGLASILHTEKHLKP